MMDQTGRKKSSWDLDGQDTEDERWINSALDRAERICGGYVVPVVCLLGIACNALNMVVLTRRQLRGSPYIYLLGLAVTDVTVLTLSVLESAICKPFGKGVYFWQVRDCRILLVFVCFIGLGQGWC